MRWHAAPILAFLAVACGARSGLVEGAGRDACDDGGATRACQTACGSGVETCVDGRFQNCTAPKPKSGELPALTATVRDFHDTHPDFEQGVIGSEPGIVTPVLGSDGKPVYAPAGGTLTTHGKSAFDQWYRDVPGVNVALERNVPLAPVQGGLYQHLDQDFFPIDGAGFGNEGRPHNYHFTLEIASSFRYLGGETFSFTGDDDLWVFINRRLAIDLGGVHGAESANVSLDAEASELGIVPGETYSLHFFFAERQTTASFFHLRTSISTFLICE